MMMHPSPFRYVISFFAVHARPENIISSQCRCAEEDAGESRTIVPRSLKDTHALGDCGASESLVVRRVDSRQERDVHAEGFVGLASRFANGIAQCVRVGLGECGEDA